MKYNPKGVGEIELNTIVLDLNGTLAVNGKIVDSVKDRLSKLKTLDFDIILLTGDQRGTANEICKELGIRFEIATSAEAKAAICKKLSRENTVAIGNARIDLGTFENAKISIATLQAEGIHAGIIDKVDIIVPSIISALDLFIDPDNFNATMRM